MKPVTYRKLAEVRESLFTPRLKDVQHGRGLRLTGTPSSQSRIHASPFLNRHFFKNIFMATLVSFVAIAGFSDLSAHHEPFDISIKKTMKIVNKYDDRYEKFLTQSRSSKSKCEKYFKRGWKYLMESPDSLWMKPSNRGNYPNSGSILVVSKWARHMGMISLQGCPDGSSITQDLARAHQFFQMGVFQYDEESMFQLGLLYINGQGVSKDEITGLTWVNMAAAEWSENARNYLEENGPSAPQRVPYQTKMLIVNETHGDNVFTENPSNFWKWVGVLSVVAISAYATYKLAPANVDATVSAVQQTMLPAIIGVSNASVRPPTMCPDGSYHPAGNCIMCPDGSQTTAPTCQMTPGGYFIGNYGNGAVLTPQGAYIPRTSSTVFCPDGRTHAGNWCQFAPDGSNVGVMR